MIILPNFYRKSSGKLSDFDFATLALLHSVLYCTVLYSVQIIKYYSIIKAKNPNTIQYITVLYSELERVQYCIYSYSTVAL